MKFTDALKVYSQYILPQHGLSSIMNAITRSESPVVKNFLIKQVIKRFDVDMGDAIKENALDYATFNHFFTRALKPDVRPICSEGNGIACPVDGAVSQIGRIEDHQIFQAKGHRYSLQALLGDDESSEDFRNGSFATIYLAPRDYHRIHSPLDARLTKMIHIPGKLFSVNTLTTQHVPGLFARNERVVSLFETSAGPMAVILVGAILVSSIETVWAGEVTSCGKKVSSWRYPQKQPELTKGEELGRFNYGSTVILLFPENKIEWDSHFVENSKTKMGQLLGKIKD